MFVCVCNILDDLWCALKRSHRVWGCVNLTRVNMGIVNLPEEVLVLILEYLSKRDKLTL